MYPWFSFCNAPNDHRPGLSNEPDRVVIARRDDMASTPCDRARPSDFLRKLEVNTTELVAKIAEAHGVSKSQAMTPWRARFETRVTRPPEFPRLD